MLYYAGVFALIALCARRSALGLVATDRMFLNPGHRVLVQSAHRAASFGAVAFLIIHIVTEILAQRVHVLDAVDSVPVTVPHLLHRPWHDRLGSHPPARYNGHPARAVQRERKSLALAGDSLHVVRRVRLRRLARPARRAARQALRGLELRVRRRVRRARARGAGAEQLAAAEGEPERAAGRHESAGSASAPMRAAAMFAQLSLARAAASQTALNARSGPQPMLTAPVGDWNERPATRPRTAWPRCPPPVPGPTAGQPLLRAWVRGTAALPGRAPRQRQHRSACRGLATGPHAAPGDRPACRGRPPGRCRAPPRARCRRPGRIRPRVRCRGPYPAAGRRRLRRGPMPRVETGPDAAGRDRSDAARATGRCRRAPTGPAAAGRHRARCHGPADAGPAA